MLPEVRHSKMIELLNQTGSIKVSELSKAYQVTEKTIREDLEKLEASGILKRVHGGAVLVESSSSLLPIHKRRVRQQAEKEQIAASACRWIEDGQILLLDGGSTTLELAKLIVHRTLTVITNDTKIASVLADCQQIELCLLGGYRRKGTYTIIGPSAIQMVDELNVDIAFLGCTGIDAERGISVFHRDEAELKKRMIRASKKTILLTDHTKFDQTALVSFASLKEIDLLITDAQTDDEVVARYTERGLEVQRAT
ncbi:DeoR/GlpR family DNA-binding transcription regulator [Paenibacillus sp. GCM10023248]|uniref:DeoR/GlpR family DNA-binding transcription regulator n=1 Tax=Bacillales TaxID=1385 RepID=UPI002377F706|nr:MULTISPECIES: DeoR/GlpR family DNA-binding transcription regulator [Bacillales]MDD9267394.1 DeoR/GlpR family DNA-binding transcription regulator [Paenibacillus sp. MAHUQ-63]MDR6882609.1 DeoR family glycerol-3-phosphate regulon repressor [Bacillus sp. 3255]